MFENFRTYAALFSIGVKNALAYRLDVFMSLLFRVSSSIIMVLVWATVYLSTGNTTIAGLTLPFMFSYFFLYKAFAMLVDVDVADLMQDDIETGNISISMIKPAGYVPQLISRAIGASFIWSVFVSIPLIAIVGIFMHVGFAFGGLGLVAVEVIMGMAVALLINFLLGTTAVYLTNIWGLFNVIDPIIAALGGGIAPLNMLPKPFDTWALMLPFQMIGYTPVATLLGVMDSAQAYNSIAVTAVWIVVLAIIATIVWNKIFRKITSVGG